MRHQVNPQEQPVGIVGMFFHLLNDSGEVARQGRIVESLPDGHYLVLWFSFIDGQVTWFDVMPIAALCGAHLFYDETEWRRRGDDSCSRQACKLRGLE